MSYIREFTVYNNTLCCYNSISWKSPSWKNRMCQCPMVPAIFVDYARSHVISWHETIQNSTEYSLPKPSSCLIHKGRVTPICVSKLTIIVSDNGLLPGWRQSIIWTNDGMLLIGPMGINFSEILIKIHTFSFKKMTSISSRPQSVKYIGDMKTYLHFSWFINAGMVHVVQIHPYRFKIWNIFFHHTFLAV